MARTAPRITALLAVCLALYAAGVDSRLLSSHHNAGSGSLAASSWFEKAAGSRQVNAESITSLVQLHTMHPLQDSPSEDQHKHRDQQYVYGASHSFSHSTERKLAQGTNSTGVKSPESTEESSNEDASLEDSSLEDSSLADSSLEDSNTEESSTEDSSLEDSSLEDSSLEESSTEDSSLEDSSLKDSSLEESSGEDSSSEESSPEESSSDEPSSEVSEESSSAQLPRSPAPSSSLPISTPPPALSPIDAPPPALSSVDAPPPALPVNDAPPPALSYMNLPPPALSVVDAPPPALPVIEAPPPALPVNDAPPPGVPVVDAPPPALSPSTPSAPEFLPGGLIPRTTNDTEIRQAAAQVIIMLNADEPLRTSSLGADIGKLRLLAVKAAFSQVAAGVIYVLELSVMDISGQTLDIYVSMWFQVYSDPAWRITGVLLKSS